MFDDLLAPHAMDRQRSRALLTALVSHALLIGIAVGRTESPPALVGRVPRDTILFQMVEAAPEYRGSASEQARPDLLLPDAPEVPAISLAAPKIQLPAPTSRRFDPHDVNRY